MKKTLMVLGFLLIFTLIFTGCASKESEKTIDYQKIAEAEGLTLEEKFLQEADRTAEELGGVVSIKLEKWEADAYQYIEAIVDQAYDALPNEERGAKAFELLSAISTLQKEMGLNPDNMRMTIKITSEKHAWYFAIGEQSGVEAPTGEILAEENP